LKGTALEDVGGVRALLGSSVVFEHLPPAGIDLVFAHARLCFLPKAAFRRLLDGHGDIARVVYGNLLRFFVGRLRRTDQNFDLILLDDRPT
jgi:hypothetical protein